MTIRSNNNNHRGRDTQGSERRFSRPNNNRGFSDHSSGERSTGERSFSDRGSGERPRSFGDRGSGERSFSDRGSGERPRSFSDRGSGERSFGGRSSGGYGRRPAFGQGKSDNEAGKSDHSNPEQLNRLRDQERFGRVARMKNQLFERDGSRAKSYTSVKVKILNEQCLPARQTPKSIGYDLTISGDIAIEPNASAILPTGVWIELPDGVEGRITGRSSALLKYNLHVAVGIVDPDYRGEIGVIVFNLGNTVCHITAGTRIAQLTFIQVLSPIIQVVDELSDTERGSNGFGSTGR